MILYGWFLSIIKLFLRNVEYCIGKVVEVFVFFVLKFKLFVILRGFDFN